MNSSANKTNATISERVPDAQRFRMQLVLSMRQSQSGYFIFLRKRGVEHLCDTAVSRHEMANWTGEICLRTSPEWLTVAGRQTRFWITGYSSTIRLGISRALLLLVQYHC